MGIVIDSNGVINVAASTPGKYRITYTTAGTCPNSSTQDITINALPTITIANSGGGFCSGSSTTITTNVSAGTIFAWYKDDVLISGQTASSLTVTEVGEYTATVTDANGCTSALSNGLDIEQFDSPSVTISTVPGTAICLGDTATLTANATGGTGTITYSWSTGAITQAIDVTAFGTYTVTVTDANGCTATASQAITASTAATTIASINNDYAMSFNGVDAYMLAETSALSGVSEFSISVWIKSNNVGVGSSREVLSATQGNTGGIVVLDNSSGEDILAHVGGLTTYNRYNNIISEGVWTHLVMVYNGNEVTVGNRVKLYKNGNLQTRSTYSGSFPSTSPNVTSSTYIGTWALNPGSAALFDGDMDELAIFNTALSSCDVKGIYEATTTVSGQPKSANLLDANTTIPVPVYWNRMGDS